MFCPHCGQERVLTETNYCSRCGFLLTGTQELLRTGGVLPQLSSPASSSVGSPRNRGLKQGLFLFLMSFLIVPIVAIITVALNVEPFGVAITAILLFVGGLLRMAYAMMFESSTALSTTDETAGPYTLTDRQTDRNALPPLRQAPASSYAAPQSGNWRDTKDLQPTSVTEGTTKLLNEDEQFPPDHERGS